MILPCVLLTFYFVFAVVWLANKVGTTLKNLKRGYLSVKYGNAGLAS